MAYKRENWRSYQKNLKKKQAHRALKRFAAKASLFLPVVIILVYASCSFVSEITPSPDIKTVADIEPTGHHLKREDLQQIIENQNLANINSKSFNISTDQKQLKVNTSIDMNLQHFLLQKISRVKKLGRGKPRYLAIVVLDPKTGKILSLAGFDQTNESANPCLTSVYPAASVFKIVTAAAAVEECGFNPYSKFKFNGGKYTLYKKQLKERSNKYTNRITFKDSFAQSVNPVFGKIGSLYLGKQALEKYATAFGFNKEINFETPLTQSHVSLSNEPYQWAEIASGFNRDTLISPLHGALLSSTIVNNGKFPEPVIIENISDSNGNILYDSDNSTSNQVIKPETSKILKKLMATTISSGTGRKSFRGYKRDPILTKLNLGGKTGSIYNNAHDVRFDWFVGYAEEKKGDMKLSIAVVVGHEKYIGTKAANYARMTIKRYFGNQFAKKESKHLFAKNSAAKQTIITR